MDAQNNKWFGTEYGISKFTGANWTTYLNEAPLRDFVFTIYIDSLGKYWFGTLGGVSVFNGQNWTYYNQDQGLLFNEVLAIAED